MFSILMKNVFKILIWNATSANGCWKKVYRKIFVLCEVQTLAQDCVFQSAFGTFSFHVLEYTPDFAEIVSFHHRGRNTSPLESPPFSRSGRSLTAWSFPQSQKGLQTRNTDLERPAWQSYFYLAFSTWINLLVDCTDEHLLWNNKSSSTL